ncbi:unnamed protein product [Sphagnum compactum]
MKSTIRQLQKYIGELSGERNNAEQMLQGDSLTVAQAQAAWTSCISTPINVRCFTEEQRPEENGGSDLHAGGKGAAAAAARRGSPKKSSSALATTASTCQFPGGTSLLVGCVLGKSSSRTGKQQERGLLKWKLSDNKDKYLSAAPPNTLEPLAILSAGEAGGGNQTVASSISIDNPCVTIQNPEPVTSPLSTMTLLFEKVASITDCRSTGHFVLPKRKVEEHFPALSRPGGVWMKLLDEFGKEWAFEFCFWHSKESRIYYFKKFYPYVQSTDLRGGDTVYFSRIEPQGTLFMGYRKQNSVASKYDQAAATPATSMNDPDYLPSSSEHGSGCVGDQKSALLAPRNELRLYGADHVNSLDRVFTKRKRRKESPSFFAHGTNVIDQLAPGEALVGEKAAGRQDTKSQVMQHMDSRTSGPLSSKWKRLREYAEEYIEWEEMHGLLQPLPGVLPTIVTIEGHDFEEYKEAPVLTKRTFFSSDLCRGGDKWVMCDNCGSWRRLSSDTFVPSPWICSNNIKDPERSHCNTPQELSDDKIEQLLGFPLQQEAVIDSQEEEHDDLPAQHFLDEQEYSEMATPELTSLVVHEDDECVAREALLSVKTSAPPVEESRRNSLTGCINLSGNSRVEKNGFKYTLGSSWVPHLQQDCLREPCAVSARRSSSYIPSGAGKGHQLCAGCEIFIGSAAQACKLCGTLTEYGARRRAQLVDELEV